MRTPSEVPMRNGGYFHLLQDLPVWNIGPRVIASQKQVTIDAEKLWLEWKAVTIVEQVEEFGLELGVEALALKNLGAVWFGSHQAWAFPMRNGAGLIVGLRLRNSHGDKWAVRGSKAGMFQPQMQSRSTLWLTEGPTSTAALLTMGFFAAGRHACLGQEEQVNQYIVKRRVREVVLVADDDPHEAGMKGMEKLQTNLKVRSVIITCCGFKDAREGLKNGLTKEILESVVSSQIWHQPP